MTSTSPTPGSGHAPRGARSGLTLLNLLLVGLTLAALVVLAVRSEPDRGVEVVRREPPPGIDGAVVEVRGAVRNPGLYPAAPGERAGDLIERAGGVTPDADLDGLNLALRVRDEDIVDVPARGEATARLIDLNIATRDDLQALPGIGPARAGAVVAARPYTEVEELLTREILPAEVFEAIRTLVVVR